MLQVHWTISFRSFKTNTLYTISILDDSYAGSPIPLIGGADPISTKEVDDEDVFTPIRTQSGYIRIVDNGKDANGNTFDWHNLIPATATSRPITLTHTENNTTVIDWAGFIQPQTFKCDFGEYVAEREFPICDWLTVLAAFNVQPTNTEYELFNFAYLIQYIFEQIPYQNKMYHFCGGEEAQDWILKEISWQPFHEEDSDKQIVSKYNCKDLLEEVCKFYGWTCRQRGKDIYFDCSTDNSVNKWIDIDEYDMEAVADGHDVQVTEETPITIQGLPGQFVSKKNEISIIRGWHKSTVITKIDGISAILEYPKEEINDEYLSYPIYRRGAGQSLYRFSKETDPKLDRESPSYTGHVNFNLKSVVIDFYTGRIRYQLPPGSDPAYEEFDGVANAYFFDYKQEQDPKTLDMKNIVEVYMGSDGTEPLFKITSKAQFAFSNGAIVLSAKTSKEHIDTSKVPNSYSPHSGMGSLTCSLKVGRKYWDGSSWTYTKSKFTVYTGQGQISGEGSISDDKVWNDGFPNFSGTKISINGICSGFVEFCIWEFLDREAADGQTQTYDPYRAGSIYLEDLKVEFLRKNTESVLNDRTENRYVAEAITPFTEEKSVELLFFSDKDNQYATNAVFNADGTYCKTVTMAGVSVHPEQHLVDRMAAWGSVTHEVMEVETDTTNNAASVTPECVIEYNGKQYSPISISRNWRDDTIKFKYIELLPTQTNS